MQRLPKSKQPALHHKYYLYIDSTLDANATDTAALLLLLLQQIADETALSAMAASHAFFCLGAFAFGQTVYSDLVGRVAASTAKERAKIEHKRTLYQRKSARPIQCCSAD